MGSVTENRELECAYHGWRFEGSGACTFVPGIASDPTARLKSRAAEPYAAAESDGFIWVYSSPQETPKSGPFRFPHLDDSHYSTVRKAFTVRGSVHAVIENTLDVPHTAFLHGGLFRTAEKKNEIEVVVRRYAAHAEAEYLGEPAPKGLVGRLLAPQGGIVTHFDRFLLPSIAQVEYRLGEKSHLISTTATTPLDDYVTQVWAVVTFRLPLPHFLVKPFVIPVAQRIFSQDARVLEAQTKVIQRFGTERYTSTELDVLGHEIFRLMSEHANGVSSFDGVKEHRIKMRT
jgi:phenylpropionate dioxygenase-like ring-hydroxylating dioxygenase large terminal subunit